MRSETQQTGRRRRGGRRHKGPREAREPESASSFAPTRIPKTAAKAPAKQGFFQRIIAFFKGKPETPGKVYGRVLDHDDSRTGQPSASTNGASSRAAAPQNGNGHGTANGNGNGPARRESHSTAEPQRTKIIRKPELVEVTSAKLYVGNLSFDATESDLSELFAGVGSVQNSEVVSHRETQKSKGFAFVTMGSIDEAKRAVTELHDKEFMGRRLVVSGAKTSDVR